MNLEHSDRRLATAMRLSLSDQSKPFPPIPTEIKLCYMLTSSLGLSLSRDVPTNVQPNFSCFQKKRNEPYQLLRSLNSVSSYPDSALASKCQCSAEFHRHSFTLNEDAHPVMHPTSPKDISSYYVDRNSRKPPSNPPSGSKYGFNLDIRNFKSHVHKGSESATIRLNRYVFSLEICLNHRQVPNRSNPAHTHLMKSTAQSRVRARRNHLNLHRVPQSARISSYLSPTSLCTSPNILRASTGVLNHILTLSLRHCLRPLPPQRLQVPAAMSRCMHTQFDDLVMPSARKTPLC